LLYTGDVVPTPYTYSWFNIVEWYVKDVHGARVEGYARETGMEGGLQGIHA
jgi:hypothetical protein